MEAAIEIEHLNKQFDGVVALSDFSARIQAGQLTGLVGPDGAGKTTLLRILAGLMKPSQGRACVAGFDAAREATSIHRVIGYMPQQFGLYEDLSVAENLTLYAELRALPSQERKSRFYHLLQFTGLEPFTHRLAGKLSGGMKQKLGLACALISKPQVLLLDEPSVGVDPLSRRDLWRMVKELTGEGVAVLWSTAYLDEAENCAEVILLDDGKIRYSGPPDQLSRRLTGRSFLVSCDPSQRREFLSQALEREGVRDGVIQGKSVRLVLDDATISSDLQTLLIRQRIL
jgi:ABC-2 type transport system ATP-binding protein